MSRDVIKEFHEASKRGDLDKAKNLLSQEKEIIVKHLDENDSLRRAVNDENLRIVKLMLKLGVNANKKERFFSRTTPFLWACAKGSLPIAKLLLENGADINTIIKHPNWTPTALHTAVGYQKAAIAKLLLENGCKTGVRNQKGLTEFEKALEKCYFAMVKLVAFHD